jgi:hypothetical protein
MDLPRLKSDSTRDLDSDKSYIRKVRNFIKDNQEMFNHGKTSDAANRTAQTNSGYSKDDSWIQRLATEKALDQLKYELLQLKATLAKNEAELQHLLDDQNKIVAQRDKLKDMVKQKEALMLKEELDKFQQALKFPEDGLFDIDPLKENLENSDEFLKNLKQKGVNTQELEESLQLIKADKKEIEKRISYRSQIEEFKQKYNISSAINEEISLDKNYTEEDYKNDKDKLLKIDRLLYNEIQKQKDGRKSNFKRLLEENKKNCLHLNHKMCEYKINSSYSKLKDFLLKVRLNIEEKINENNTDLSVNDLNKDIYGTLETIIGPNRGKKQKQVTRIKQAEMVLQKQLEESEEKIQAIHHKNDSLKNKIHELEDQIGDYI